MGSHRWPSRVVIWVFVCGWLTTLSACSGAEPAEQLIARVLAQAGGRDVVAELTGVYYRGSFELYENGERSRHGTHETTIAFPDRLAQKRSFVEGSDLIRVFDRGRGFMQVDDHITALDVVMADELRAYIDTRYVAIVRLLAAGAHVEEVRLPDAEPNGHRVFLLETQAGEARIEIDPRQARIVGLTSRLVAFGEEESSLRQTFDEFRRVSSIELPHLVESTSRGALYSRRREDAVEANPRVDDAVFTLADAEPES